MLEEKFNELMELFETVKTRHEKFREKGNKTAEADVRKSLSAIKKLITPYKKLSVTVTNEMKKR